MFRKRWSVLLSVILVIAAGLLSRKIAIVPLWVGDALWANMVYLMVRLVWINQRVTPVAIASLLFSFVIEFSQLYQAQWINAVRNTTIGHLILGKGFLWSDLLAYMLGVLVGIIIDILVFKSSKTHLHTPI